MDVEAYASKMLSIGQRVEELLGSSILQVFEWFNRGPNPQCHAVVSTKKIKNWEHHDQLIDKVKIIQRRVREKIKKKRKKTSRDESGSFSFSFEDSMGDIQKKNRKGKEKRKVREKVS